MEELKLLLEQREHRLGKARSSSLGGLAVLSSDQDQRPAGFGKSDRYPGAPGAQG